MPGISLAALALSASTSFSVPVEVGRFDPANFPDLIKLERQLPHGEMTRRVEKILEERRCELSGQSHRRFDITVPYAVLMNTAGKPQRIVVAEVGCAPIETLVGQIIIAQSDRGDFRIQHNAGDRWYSSDVYFSMGEPVAAGKLGDKDKVICKKDEQPMLGTRLKFNKTCKTAAQWQAYENDREQLRRDLRNAGACGQAAICTSD